MENIPYIINSKEGFMILLENVLDDYLERDMFLIFQISNNLPK